MKAWRPSTTVVVNIQTKNICRLINCGSGRLRGIQYRTFKIINKTTAGSGCETTPHFLTVHHISSRIGDLLNQIIHIISYGVFNSTKSKKTYKSRRVVEYSLIWLTVAYQGGSYINTLFRWMSCYCRDAVCIFYLVLRALDTVEDDMTIPLKTKVPMLKEFYTYLENPDWKYMHSEEKDKMVLEQFPVVCNTYFTYIFTISTTWNIPVHNRKVRLLNKIW